MTARGRENIHEYLDCGSLAGAVRAHQGVYSPFVHSEIEIAQSFQPAEFLYHAFSPNRVHRPPRPPLSESLGEPPATRRFQWAAITANTWSRPIPSFFASTTSCSISYPSNCVRSVLVASGSSATTVPMPGRLSSKPSTIKCVITLWAVFGLTFSSLLRLRTE